jgi:hypothetical protein
MTSKKVVSHYSGVQAILMRKNALNWLNREPNLSNGDRGAVGREPARRRSTFGVTASRDNC